MTEQGGKARIAETSDEDQRNEQDDERDIEELLDWLCYCWATTGDRFYPPGETAEECVEALELEDNQFACGKEYGQHSRAWLTAVQRFEDLESWGFNPKARAVRYDENSSGEHTTEIDWSWWEDVQSND